METGKQGKPPGRMSPKKNRKQARKQARQERKERKQEMKNRKKEGKRGKKEDMTPEERQAMRQKKRQMKKEKKQQRRKEKQGAKQACQSDADCEDGCCFMKRNKKNGVCKTKFAKRGENAKCRRPCHCADGLDCFISNRMAKRGKMVGKCLNPANVDNKKGSFMTTPAPATTTES